MQSALSAARAAAAGAAAALAQAQRDLARATALDCEGFISRAQLEATRTRVWTDRAALEQAQAETRRIAAAPGAAGRDAPGIPVAFVAPIGGSVLLLPNNSEGMVMEGGPLMTIGDPARVEVVVDLLYREAAR